MISREEQDKFAQWEPQDEMPLVIRFTLHGSPITKKNSINLVDIGRQCPTCRRKAKSIPLPSTAFKNYEKAVKAQLCFVSQRTKGPIAVKAVYWLQSNRKTDLNNLMGATADILQAAGIIDDDANILSWDGSRIAGKDAKNPRVEITIEKL